MAPAGNTAGISRFPVATLDGLPADLRERILAVRDKAGFVPNVFLVLGHRPEQLRLFMDYHDLLMQGPSGLSKSEREMIVVVTSAANRCRYCVVAHGAIVRVLEKRPALSDDLVIDHHLAGLTPRQVAMLDYALRVARDAATLTAADHAGLRGHGFSDEDIWDIGAVAAFFGMSNRLAGMTGMVPNDEFYRLGRVLRTAAE
jgi:uncharacterized peroxidase-related enzyme